MIKDWLHDVSKLLFPNNCFSCGLNLVSNEQHICSSCLTNLPQTNFYKHKENALSEKLKGRFDFEQAMALYYFNTEGKIQEILHEIKYRNNPYLATYMGQYMAGKLQDVFDDVDLIIAVPLHSKRTTERGYNQSELLAQGFSERLGIPLFSNAVKRIKNTETQTHKTRLERLENIKQAFQWKEQIKGKHILLIDDVITTGSTLESLVRAMPIEYDNKISILSLAAAIES